MGIIFKCNECGRKMNITTKTNLSDGTKIFFDCPHCGRMVNDVRETIEVII